MHFVFVFYDKVIDKMCEWMNARAAEYFHISGKRKVNGLIWRPATRDDMYVFFFLAF